MFKIIKCTARILLFFFAMGYGTFDGNAQMRSQLKMVVATSPDRIGATTPISCLLAIALPIPTIWRNWSSMKVNYWAKTVQTKVVALRTMH